MKNKKKKSAFSLAEKVFFKKSSLLLAAVLAVLIGFSIFWLIKANFTAIETAGIIFAIIVLCLVYIWTVKRKKYIMNRSDRISKLSIILDLFGIVYRFCFPLAAFWAMVELLHWIVTQSITT